MLDALRRGATGWLAKVLFAILVLSFAVWGIPNEFLGGGGNYVARVGSVAIGPTEFQRVFNQALAAGQQEGRRMSAEEARQRGLDRLVLQQMVGQAALKAYANKLGLALPNDALVEQIRTAKAFQGTDGRFSPARFEAYLEQSDLSEQGLLQLLREDELNAQLTSALNNAIAVPSALIDLQNAYREQTRVIEHITINPQKVPPPADPDEAKLKETFEQNRAQFATPEYRKIIALILSVDDLKKSVDIPEADLQAAYEATKNEYEEPERRRVAQITFNDKAAADAAKKDIAGGKSFADATAAAGLKESDTDLGKVRKADLIDAKVADAAFALKKDEVSDVIEGAFAPVLLRVTEITPGKVSTFEEVKERLRNKIAAEKAATLIQDTSERVEEGLNAGKTLKEIGGELKLNYVEIDTDMDNKTAEGKVALAHPDAAVIIQTAFAMTPGTESTRIDLPASSGYAWPSLLTVTPSQPKEFDAVKEEVKALYLERESRDALGKLATSLVGRLSKGEDLAAVAADAGGAPETTLPITRMTSPQGLPHNAVAQAFALPQGQAGSATTSDGKSGVVFRVKEIKPAPAPSKEQTDKLTSELAQSLQQDLWATFVGTLEGQQSVSVNTREFRRVTGAASDQQ